MRVWETIVVPVYVEALLFFPRHRLRHLSGVLAFPLQTIKDGILMEGSLMETFHAINLYLTVAIGWRSVCQKGSGAVVRQRRREQVRLLVSSELRADVSLHQAERCSGWTSMTRWATSGMKLMRCASVSEAAGGD